MIAQADPRRSRRGLKMRVEEVPLRDLVGLGEAWSALGEAAVVPNPFYEPWMLLPAVEHFGAGRALSCALVLGSGSADGGPELLCGLFPLERARLPYLPVEVLRLWRHLHCYSAQPLVRAGVEREVLEALVAWFDARPGRRLLELALQPARGAWHDAIYDVLEERAQVQDVCTRAFVTRAADATSYFSRALSGERRRVLRRCARHLGAAGPLRYRRVTTACELPFAVEQFLRLEASGWKGQEGSALASSPQGARFFADVAQAAFARDRLLLWALDVGDRPVAMFAAFRAAGGVFSFKSAMDEQHARFSPGTLLFLHVLEELHQLPADAAWLDTCSSWSSPLKLLCTERLPLATLMLAAPRRLDAQLCLGALPLMRQTRRWARHLLGRER